MLPEIIALIWQACDGKHDSIIRTLYEIIIMLSSYMGKDSLALLYQKLKSVDLRLYNELTLNLLKEFCENVISLPENSTRSLDASEVTDEFVEAHFLGVNVLWALVLDSSPLSAALTEEALGVFRSLLASPNCKPLRRHFLIKSIREVERASSVPQCLFVITKIFHMNLARKSDNEAQMRAFLGFYENNFGLSALVIRDLARYAARVRTEFPEKLARPGFFDEVFEGKHSHKSNLELRLNFLEIYASYALLSEADLQQLWEIFVLQPLNPLESALYFQWLAYQNESAKGEIHITLAKPLLLFQFRDILCNPTKNDFRRLREEGFNLFYLFFLNVNLQERNFRVSKAGKLSSVNPSSVTGLQVLWQILEENENEKVIERVSEVLSELHLRVAAGGEEAAAAKRRDSAERFTTFVMGMLKDACAGSRKLMINKAIYLLIVFFEKFEGKFFKSSRASASYHFLNVTVVLRPENLQKEVRMNVYDQVGSFRRRISEEFGIPLKQLKLIHKSDVAVGDSDDDEMPMREFGIVGVYFVFRRKESCEEEDYHPKHLISESQEYLDLLFRLLSEADPGKSPRPAFTPSL